VADRVSNANGIVFLFSSSQQNGLEGYVLARM
jgi:hypothetical protein